LSFRLRRLLYNWSCLLIDLKLHFVN
jgi:hypothetical protein